MDTSGSSPLITLFAIPKPFQGHIGTIQHNAVESWTKLGIGCEVVLLGSDYGIAGVAAELGLRHIPDTAVNEHGTPLVNDLFEQAEQAANSQFMCYVNSDIILMGDFLQAIRAISSTAERFLMVGQRWDLDLFDRWDFESPDWESILGKMVADQGILHSKAGIDYFAFSKGLLAGMPPFAIGRTAWDNWIISCGRRRSVPVVDATARVMAVHQNHDYGNFGSKNGLWSSQEAQINQKMMGTSYSTLEDVSHLLRSDGLHSAWTLGQFLRRPRRLIGRYPLLGLPNRMADIMLRNSRHWRTILHLTRSQWTANKS